MVVTPISTLRYVINPSAIRRFVITVIVNSVDTKANRAITHVGEELLKRIKPNLANLNASASVVLVTRLIRVCASSLYSFPAMILNSVRQAMLKTCSTSFSRHFFKQAPARFYTLRNEVVPTDRFERSAVTNTVPHDIAVFVISTFTEYGKAIKNLTREVGIMLHNILSDISQNRKGAEDWSECQLSACMAYPRSLFYHIREVA